jgi:hypothetical protein
MHLFFLIQNSKRTSKFRVWFSIDLMKVFRYRDESNFEERRTPMKWFFARFPNERLVYVAYGLKIPQEGETISSEHGLMAFDGMDLTGAIVVKILSEEMTACIFHLTFFTKDLKVIAEQIQNAVAFGFETQNALAICKQRRAEGATAFGAPDFVSAHVEPLLWECVTLGMALRPTQESVKN